MNYRSKYRSMPRLTHSAHAEESQVIAHIRETEGCDTPMAISIWEQIRRPSRRIVVFDRVDRSWVGWDLSSSEQQAKSAAAQTLKRIRNLETRLATLQENFDRLVEFVNGKAA